MVYSLDLRQRIFAVYQSGEDSVRRIAARFSVTQATVKNLVRLELFRATNVLRRF
jgi:transposase